MAFVALVCICQGRACAFRHCSLRLRVARDAPTRQKHSIRQWQHSKCFLLYSIKQYAECAATVAAHYVFERLC